MCDRPPAGEATGSGEDFGHTAHEAVPARIDAQGTRLPRGSTAECHVVRGYRFHRPSASDSGCPATRVGACPGDDEPDGSCRAAAGFVDAQTTLRICTCDRRWFRRPTALPDTTLKRNMSGPRRAAERKVKDVQDDQDSQLRNRPATSATASSRACSARVATGSSTRWARSRSRSSRSAARGWPTRSST